MEQGRQLYAAQQYAQAIEAFIQVINSCRCGVHLREKPCLCKDLLASIDQGSLRDELRKPCICSAGSGRRCEDATHIDAFDSLAATYEKEDRVEQSLSCAKQMINLSPRNPKGYLRCGKVLRLQGLPNLAHKTYRVGIDVVSKKHAGHPLLQKLREQEDKLRHLMRADPLIMLPFELVCLIFQQADFRTLCRCLSVCKNWKSVLTAKEAQGLWRVQHYQWEASGVKRKVSTKSLMRYSFFAGHQVTSLAIDNCKYFGLNTYNLNAIFARCKQLKHLKIRGGGGGAGTSVVLDVPPSTTLPALDTLYLGFGVTMTRAVLRRLLHASPGIEELSIFDLGGEGTVDFNGWPLLHKLKTIRLANSMGSMPIHMNKLIRLTPNAVSVWIDSSVWLTGPEDEHSWESLQSLFVGEKIIYPTTRVWPAAASANIQELYLELITAGSHHHLDQLLATSQALDGVKRLTIKTREPLSKPNFEALIRPSFKSNKIEQLSISPFPFANVPLENEDMSWFGSSNLTCLSLTGLTLEAGRSIGSADDTLLSMVKRFPNLEILNIDKERIQPSTLAKIVTTTRVRTIYHLSGYLMEEARLWAAEKHGGRIIHGYRPSPAQLPDRPLVCTRLAHSLRRPREH